MSLPDTAPDLFWEPLIECIKERRVVPVVGPELLRVKIGGRDLLLYDYLAERLAAKLGVSGPAPPSSLHEVACRYLDQHRDIEDVYAALKSVMPPPEELPIPEPLLQLARIEAFQIFVTTTFDPLLERALNQVRFEGRPRTRVYSYSPSDPQDIPENARELSEPIVYHLFGKLSSVPDYAVTEEDVLEFVHSLQSEDRRPPHLFDELTHKHLLVLGGSFPDWLARFFVRIAKSERLSAARGKTDILADTRISSESGLVFFLQRFSSRTKVFQGGGPMELVDELASRWSVQSPPEPALPVPERSLRPVVEGSVFLSYAHEDRGAVEAIRDELERAHVDVWLDREDLQPGDPWEEKILRGIEKCSVFVPVLSRHVLTPQRRFFRLEWDQADRVARLAPLSMSFIVPVALDDIAESSEDLPRSFREAHWLRLADGRPTPELVSTLRQRFREYQKSLVVAS